MACLPWCWQALSWTFRQSWRGEVSAEVHNAGRIASRAEQIAQIPLASKPSRAATAFVSCWYRCRSAGWNEGGMSVSALCCAARWPCSAPGDAAAEVKSAAEPAHAGGVTPSCVRCDRILRACLEGKGGSRGVGGSS